MYEYNEDYANEILEKPLTEYKENGDVIKLVNTVSVSNENYVSLALYYANQIDFTKALLEQNAGFMLGDLEGLSKDLQNQLKDKDLQKTINSLSNVLNKNNDIARRVSDIVSKDMVDNGENEHQFTTVKKSKKNIKSTT